MIKTKLPAPKEQAPECRRQTTNEICGKTYSVVKGDRVMKKIGQDKARGCDLKQPGKMSLRR